MSHFPTMFDPSYSYVSEEFYSSPQWTPEHQQFYSPVQQQYESNYHVQCDYNTTPPYTNFNQLHHYSDNKLPNASIPVKRKRASKPKVRTGCKTCKIRRVKCGEEKPACLRCTSTGRKCDGYEHTRKEKQVVKTGSEPNSPLPNSPSEPELQVARRETKKPELFLVAHLSQSHSIFQGTTQEKRAFHRFKQRTIPALSGGSETEFWTDIVVRTAISEPVIREAVIALGTLHEGYELSDGRSDPESFASAAYKDSARLYGLAIRHLYQRIDTNTGSTASLAIIASILFACFEVLRRDNMAAVMHYQTGMRQLMKTIGERDREQLEGPRATNGKSSIAVVRATPQDDLDRMLRVFARYDVQACTFSKQRVEALRVELQAIPRTDVGLSEVRRYLDNLLIAVYQLVKSDLSMFRYWKAADVSSAWIEKRDQAIETFQGWLEALEKSIPSDTVTLRNHGITASKSILGLVLQVKVAMIMLRTCIDSGAEMSFDRFTNDFEEIVSRVEQLMKALQTSPSDFGSLPFNMELGVIHPLFFVASKCRDWRLRRRAIAMLRKCGKEGVWEGPIMALVAEKVVQFEEQGLEYGSRVPELARVHDIRKTIDYENGVIKAEMRRATDLDWKNWTVSRETIPFR